MLSERPTVLKDRSGGVFRPFILNFDQNALVTFGNIVEHEVVVELSELRIDGGSVLQADCFACNCTLYGFHL